MVKRIFCNAQCSEGYRTDRRYGLIYGAILVCEQPHRHSMVMADGCFQSWYGWHVRQGLCPYCNARVVAYRRAA